MCSVITTRSSCSKTSSLDRSTPTTFDLNGRSVWPPQDGRPEPAIHMREGERQARLVFGSCRVGAPETPPYTLAPSDDPKGLGVDALWAYSRRLQTGDAPWPDGLLLLGDQIYADEVPAGDRGVHRRPPQHGRPTRRVGRGLRGVRAALPRVVVRPRHPLAARDGAVDDDLRRPRGERRLEHLAVVGRRDARAAVVGRTDHERVHGVLAVPASRQPLAARARRGGDVRAGAARRGRRAAASHVRAHVRPRVGREPLGVLPRLRPLAPAGDRFACRARPRRRSPRHGRRGRVGVDRPSTPEARSTI